MTQPPATASLREFAVIAGFKPAYAHQLKRDDRLVLADDGKTVHVQASLDRIRATRDPAKAAVAARHAAQRAASTEVPATVQSATGAPGAHAGAPEVESPDNRIGNNYQTARAVKERFLALAAKRDYEISIGKLLAADHVRAAVADAATQLRARLETLPDTLGPQLAGIADESQCRATLAEAIEHALTEAARKFQAIAPA